MLASIQIAGFSSCGPVAVFVIVHSQMSRSSYDFPMLESSIRSGYAAARASRISVSSGNLTKRSKGTWTPEVGVSADMGREGTRVAAANP
jgi:hypothetical protein